MFKFIKSLFAAETPEPKIKTKILEQTVSSCIQVRDDRPGVYYVTPVGESCRARYNYYVTLSEARERCAVEDKVYYKDLEWQQKHFN